MAKTCGYCAAQAAAANKAVQKVDQSALTQQFEAILKNSRGQPAAQPKAQTIVVRNGAIVKEVTAPAAAPASPVTPAPAAAPTAPAPRAVVRGGKVVIE